MPPKKGGQGVRPQEQGGVKMGTALKVAFGTTVVVLAAALVLELVGGPLGVRTESRSGAKIRRRPPPENTPAATSKEDADLIKLAAGMQEEHEKRGANPVAKVPLKGLRYALVILQGVPTEEDGDEDEGGSNNIEEKLVEKLSLGSNKDGKQKKDDDVREMRTIAAASLASYIAKTLIPSLDGKSAEDIEAAWALEHKISASGGGVPGFFTELTETLIKKKYVAPPATQDGSSACDCNQGSWTATMLDLGTAVSDVWFHLDQETQHQRILYSQLTEQRPWLNSGYASPEGICDTDSVTLCERSRAFVLEELVALDPSNYVYRSMYAATLIWGMKRYEEAIIFLERYQERMLTMSTAQNSKTRAAYDLKYKALHQWSHPMLLFARTQASSDPTGVTQGEGSGDSGSAGASTMTPEQAKVNLCVSLLQAPFPQQGSVVPEHNTATGKSTQYHGEDPSALEALIGVTQGEVKVMARMCSQSVQSHVDSQFAA